MPEVSARQPSSIQCSADQRELVRVLCHARPTRGVALIPGPDPIVVSFQLGHQLRGSDWPPASFVLLFAHADITDVYVVPVHRDRAGWLDFPASCHPTRSKALIGVVSRRVRGGSPGSRGRSSSGIPRSAVPPPLLGPAHP